MAEDNFRFPGLGVLFPHVLQLAHDDLTDAGGLLQGILQVLNFLLQGGGLLDPLEDVLLIDVAQLDLCYILRLNLVDAEADHQVGHHLRLLLGLADDLNGLVNVQQNALEALQKVQLFLLFVQHEVHSSPHAFRAPGQPLLQQRLHPQHPGHSGDEDVKVAAHRVLQGGQAEELLHELVRVYAPLQVNGQLQAREVRLVPHVADLLDLSGLHQLGHLVQNGLQGGGIGDLENFDNIFALDITVLGPDLHTAPARLINAPQLLRVTENLPAGGKIRGQQGGGNVVVWIFQQLDGGVADLPQVKAADLGRHAHGDALVGRHQHIGIGGGQQGRFLGGVVVVIHKVHGVAVQIPEKLRADRGQLCLGVAAGGVGHVPGVDLAEVALAVHKGVEQ